jgi:TolB-like protein/Tfp pilus assembly protein PilF
MSGQGSNTNDGLPKRAVFLSYAREDSPAAQRITDALRSQGIEVWFDLSELRGGDVWDQKIRKQIKDCALFMPVISERTQSRGEGYFRLEWRLAVERTHLMAEGVPFLSPVVVDGTPESAALVPPEFLRVQWTRLPSALPTPQFVEQVQRMLERPGQVPVAAKRHTASTQELRPRTNVPLIGGAIAAVVIAIAATFFLMRKPAAAPVLATPPAPTEQVAAVDSKSIAVLPFANMSEEKDNEFFTDGVHEDVLTNLSFVKDLHVVSRTSVMQYRNTTKSIKAIAQELGVAFILEGSVRRVGNKVRVTGQLIDARTDEHIWAKAYDRDLNDIFAIQGELAQSIAEALQAVLDPQTKVLLARRPTENTAAYDEYLKARHLREFRVFGADQKAIGLLEDAVKLDPNFAQAWAELASQRAFVFFGGVRGANLKDKAKEAIDNAVRLAPDDPAVIEGLGDYYYYAFRDYARSTEQYMRLEQIRPNDAVVFFSLGLIQRREGRFADAIPNLRKGVALDPTNRGYLANLYDTLVNVRQYDEAIAFLRKYTADHPDDVEAFQELGVVLYDQSGSKEGYEDFKKRSFPDADPGEINYFLKQNAATVCDWDEVIRLDRIQRYYDGNPQDPRFGQDALMATCLFEMGDVEAARTRASEALAAVAPLLAKGSDNPLLWLTKAFASAMLGNKADALKAVDRVHELMPESRDAIQGAQMAGFCSYILVVCGENDRGLDEIERLLHTPWGLNTFQLRGSVRLLKDDPRFKALLADPKNNAPLF